MPKNHVEAGSNLSIGFVRSMHNVIFIPDEKWIATSGEKKFWQNKINATEPALPPQPADAAQFSYIT